MDCTINLKDRINAFGRLGEALKGPFPLPEATTRIAMEKNPWFTQENIEVAIKSIAELLHPKTIEKWTSKYALSPYTSKTIGVVMAGNIPLVGFHDLLSVLIAGHNLQAKLSTKDTVLPTHIAKMLMHIEPRFKEKISFQEHLSNYDAVIATGSNNSSRYFKAYFNNVPHIIRKNRTSCAILTGNEKNEELDKLGEDILLYFGLGCRNVSKLYLPQNYNLLPLLKRWEQYNHLINNYKYAHNYNYQKAIHLIEKRTFFDNGVILLVESKQLVSPVSVVYYETYKHKGDLVEKITQQQNSLQCIVAHNSPFPQNIPFGQAQYPKIWEYADGEDTLAFISSLHEIHTGEP